MEQRSGIQNLILDIASNFHRWVSNLVYYLIKIFTSIVNTILDQIQSF